MHFNTDQINDLEKIKKINLIGSISNEGITNVAVFSSITHLGSNPPTLGFIVRPTTVPRDTYKNIMESGIFTINHVYEDILEDAHHTSAKYEEEISEFDITELEAEYHNDCKAPFVKGSPVQMEMRFIEEYHIKSNNVIHIIAEIKNLYVKDDILQEDGFLDLAKGKVAAINGLDAYAVAKNNSRFNYQRPKKLKTMK